MNKNEINYRILKLFDVKDGCNSTALNNDHALIKAIGFEEAKFQLYALARLEYVWQRGNTRGAVYKTSPEGIAFMKGLVTKV